MSFIISLVILAFILYIFDRLVPTSESNQPIKLLIWAVVAIWVLLNLVNMLSPGLGGNLNLPRFN